MAKESVKSREERAKNSTSPAELEKLVEDEDWTVRHYVAVNEKTPVSLLAKLAEDINSSVSEAVAHNVNTPVPLLEKLAENKGEYVRKAVARNVNSPVSLLEKLAEDKEGEVRISIAENANTPASVLEKLASSSSAWIRILVAENENAPVTVLEKLAEEEDKDVRTAVAANENTPAAALEKLAKDKKKDVRKAAATNVNIPPSALKKLEEMELEHWFRRAAKDDNSSTVKCSAYYTVWEKEQEDGTFTVKKNGKAEEIEGYMTWVNKTSGTLIWELPDSADAAIETLEKDEWSDEEIEYDDKEGFEDSVGKSSEAFDENDNTIEDYDDFESGGSTEVVGFSSSYGPSDINITYENQKEVVFESSGGGSWTMKTADGQPETIPNYEEVLVLVRNLLK